MKPPLVYLDTSVIGGCCDEEFRKWSLALMRDIQSGLLAPMVSNITETELKEAPQEVQAVYDDLMEGAVQRVQESPESIELARKYISEGILTENFEYDARHIAVAAVSGADIVVSWNFKHIVRFDKILRFNAVNVLLGYKQLQIFSPMEVVREEL
ncbi:MAG: PIN domain protein [Elusimicrobia bacterium]|nr:PIN domain protein [Elusimicrobiota bacterium]